MPFGIRLAVILVSGFVMTGCAANDLVVKRQAENEAKVEHLIQSGKKNDQRLNELSVQQLSQSDQLKNMEQQLKQAQEAIRELRVAQEELKARLTLAAQQAATPKIEVVNPEPAQKPARESGPPADYVKAFGQYSANNFAAAITMFDAFVNSNPQSDFVPNALYWIGECHYSLSDLPKAKEFFFKVAGNYPNSPKAPDSLLKLGYTLAAMNEKDKAHAIFESLVQTYPSSPAAIKARDRLSAK